MKLPFPQEVLSELAQADPYAVEQLAGCGPNIFNPIIGDTPAETFENIAKVSSLLFDLVKEKQGLDAQDGLALVLQSVWYAALYEGGRNRGAEA